MGVCVVGWLGSLRRGRREDEEKLRVGVPRRDFESASESKKAKKNREEERKKEERGRKRKSECVEEEEEGQELREGGRARESESCGRRGVEDEKIFFPFFFSFSSSD